MARTTLVSWPRVMPPLPPSAWLRRPASTLPYPLAEPGCSLFACSRHALWHALPALGLAAGDEVLVPAYHAGPEIEAYRVRGLVCRFYDATPTLEPDPEELDRLYGPRTRALHVTHYLGLPQDGARWRRFCDERGLLLVEDAAMAWLAERGGRPAGSFGDAAIFSLYKTVGVPDGAALHLSRGRADGAGGGHPLGLASAARRHAAWLGARPGPLARAATAPLKARRQRLPARELRRETVRLGDPDRAPALVSRLLAPRLAGPRCAERRRRNYGRLLEALGERVPTAFRRLEPGASPFAFPLGTDALLEHGGAIGRTGVGVNAFWLAPHPLTDLSAHPGAAALYGGVLLLPVHQELLEADVERIVEVAAATVPRVGTRERVQGESTRLAPGSRARDP